MIVGTIAKQIVEFSVSGLSKAIAGVRGTLNAMKKMAVETTEQVKALTNAVGNAAKIGAGLGAGFLATFGRGAMEGTVEADRLGKAFTYLTRVVGDSLAPYVRMLTDYIIQAAQAYRALSPETKKTITQVALFAAGIGTALVVLPTLITTVGALGAALAAIFSPAALAIAGIAALADAATGLFDFMREEAPATADAVDEANRTWVDRFLGYIEKITIAGANFFNQYRQKCVLN